MSGCVTEISFRIVLLKIVLEKNDKTLMGLSKEYSGSLYRIFSWTHVLIRLHIPVT